MSGHRRPTVAIYIRTANPQEPEAHRALEEQRTACLELLNQRFGEEGYDCTVYDEGAASGATGLYDPANPGKAHRPVLSGLVKQLEDGGLDAVCVHRIDRLGRNVAFTSRLLAEVFPENGVELISVVEGVQGT